MVGNVLAVLLRCGRLAHQVKSSFCTPGLLVAAKALFATGSRAISAGAKVKRIQNRIIIFVYDY
jgi:hypothetical protein